jgi:hypothetical protein
MSPANGKNCRQEHIMAKSKTPSLIRTIALMWMSLVSDPYRPELYYMRGPGPKWNEKHGTAEHAGQPDFSGLGQATA